MRFLKLTSAHFWKRNAQASFQFRFASFFTSIFNKFCLIQTASIIKIPFESAVWIEDELAGSLDLLIFEPIS